MPARDCVIEIYIEGSTDTYGTLYNECKSYVISNNDGNGNGNFKISYHFKGMQWYYIAVRHSSASSRNYTLRFQFAKDYCDQLLNE